MIEIPMPAEFHRHVKESDKLLRFHGYIVEYGEYFYRYYVHFRDIVIKGAIDKSLTDLYELTDLHVENGIIVAFAEDLIAFYQEDMYADIECKLANEAEEKWAAGYSFATHDWYYRGTIDDAPVIGYRWFYGQHAQFYTIDVITSKWDPHITIECDGRHDRIIWHTLT